MWQRVLGLADKPDDSTKPSRRKEESRSQRTGSESAPSSSSTRKQSRGDDRDRGINPTSTSYSSSSRSPYPGGAAPSLASSYATAQANNPDDGVRQPDLVRSSSLADNMPRTRSERDDRSKAGDEDRKSRRRRDRSSSRDRKGHRRDRSRSEERNDRSDKKEKKLKRRGTDPTVLGSVETSRAGEVDRFNARIGSAGFTQFPGQFDSGMPNMPSSNQRPQNNMSDHVPDMFPGQFPSGSTAPYRPPMAKSEGGPGLAADYYGDAGQSVSQQPGLRTHTPDLIVGTEPHLMMASSVAAPPPEPSSMGQEGSAAAFWNTEASFQTPNSSPKPAPQSGSRPQGAPYIAQGALSPGLPPQSYPGQSISISPMTSSSNVATIGAAAASAAAGLAAGQHSLSQQNSGFNSYQGFGPQELPGSDSPLPPSNSTRPSKLGKHSSSNVPIAAAAAGAAGLAAAAYQHHQSHQNSYQYQNGSGHPIAMVHRHHHSGPFSKFVDFFRDPEGVAEFEEYTEYIGVCRGCFEPGSSPRDAPRKHHYRRKRSSEKLRSSTRVDKENRYYVSSDGENRRRSQKGWLATAAAGIGLAQAGKTFFGDPNDFQDTYSVKSGRVNESVTPLPRRSSPSSYRRTSTMDESRRRGDGRKVEFGITVDDDMMKKVSRRSNEAADTTTAHAVDRKHRKRSRSRSRERDHKFRDAAIGAAAGAALVSSASRKRTPSPEEHVLRLRHGSHQGSVERKSHHSRHSPEPSTGILGGFFSPPEQKSGSRKKKSKRQQGFFNFSNGSSSSSDAGLAFGGPNRRDTSRRKTSPKIKSDAEASAALIGLGTAAAALAAHESRSKSKSHRGPNVVAVKDTKGKHRDQVKHADPKADHKHKRSRSDSLEEEDLWESASENEGYSSIDSALAFGISRRGSRESIKDSGTDKWDWRWGSKKQRRPSGDGRESHFPTSAATAAAAGIAGAATGAALASRDKYPGTGMHSTGSLQSLQHVYPVPTSDPTSYDAVVHDPVTGQPHRSTRPAPVPIQQPRPIVPVPSAVYTQAPLEQSYTAPSGPPVFAQAPLPGGYDERSTYYTSMPGAFQAEEGKAIDYTSRRRDNASSVKFGLSEEQEERQRREERRERRRSEKAKSEAERREYEEQIILDRERRDAERNRRGNNQKSERRSEKQESEIEHQKRRLETEVESIQDHQSQRHAEIERELQKLIQEEPPASKPRKESKGHTAEYALAGAALAGAATGAAAAAIAQGSQSSERKRQAGKEERRRRTEEQVADDEVREEKRTSKSKGGFAGLVGAMVAGQKEEDSRDNEEPSKIESSVHEGAKGPHEAVDDRRSRERKVARQAPVKVRIARSQSPAAHESYASYFAPDDILSKPAGEKQKASDPNADTDITAHDVIIEPPQFRGRYRAPEIPKYVNETFEQMESRQYHGRVVPPLNLIYPTPSASRAGSRASSVQPSPIITPKHEPVEELEEEPQKTSRRVSFGDNQTHEYDVITPEDHRDEFISSAAATTKAEEAETRSTRSAVTPADVESPVEEIPRRSMPDVFDDDPEFAATLAAGAEAAGFDPDIVIDDPMYRRRDSPPGSQERQDFYRQPFYETVSDIAVESPRSRGAPPQRGWVEEDELPETPKDNPAEDSKDSDPDASRRARRKRERAAKRRSMSDETITTGAEAQPRPEEKDVVDPDDAELEIIEDAAKDVPAEFIPAKSKKTKSKKSKRDSTSENGISMTRDHETELRGISEDLQLSESAQKRGQSNDKPVDVMEGADGKARSTQPQEEDEIYESPNEYAASTASAPTAIDREDEKRRKKKSKRRSTGYDDTASVASSPAKIDDAKEISSKSKKKGGSLWGLFGKSSEDVTKKEEAKGQPAEGREEVEEPKRKSKKGRKSRDLDDWYSAPSESVADLSKTTDELYDQQSPKASKGERRRSRRDSRGDDEIGRRSQDLPDKEQELVTGSAIRSKQHPTDDYEAVDGDDKQEKPQSFLGMRREETEPPDISENAHDPGGGDYFSRRRSTSSPPTSRPSTPPKIDWTHDDIYGETEISPSRPRRLSMLQSNTVASPVTPSPTAIPLVFRKPPSAGLTRSSSATPVSSPSLATPRTRRPRPHSTEFKTNEFRPLWLIERHQSKPEFDSEEILPSLPSSHSGSRASSVHEGEVPSQERAETARASKFKGDPLDIAATKVDRQEILDSQETTPTAASYKAKHQQERGEKTREREQDLIAQATQEAMAQEHEWNQKYAKESQHYAKPEPSPYWKDAGLAALAGTAAAVAFSSSQKDSHETNSTKEQSYVSNTAPKTSALRAFDDASNDYPQQREVESIDPKPESVAHAPGITINHLQSSSHLTQSKTHDEMEENGFHATQIEEPIAEVPAGEWSQVIPVAKGKKKGKKNKKGRQPYVEADTDGRDDETVDAPNLSQAASSEANEKGVSGDQINETLATWDDSVNTASESKDLAGPTMEPLSSAPAIESDQAIAAQLETPLLPRADSRKVKKAKKSKKGTRAQVSDEIDEDLDEASPVITQASEWPPAMVEDPVHSEGLNADPKEYTVPAAATGAAIGMATSILQASPVVGGEAVPLPDSDGENLSELNNADDLFSSRQVGLEDHQERHPEIQALQARDDQLEQMSYTTEPTQTTSVESKPESTETNPRGGNTIGEQLPDAEKPHIEALREPELDVVKPSSAISLEGDDYEFTIASAKKPSKGKKGRSNFVEPLETEAQISMGSAEDSLFEQADRSLEGVRMDPKATEDTFSTLEKRRDKKSKKQRKALQVADTAEEENTRLYQAEPATAETPEAGLKELNHRPVSEEETPDMSSLLKEYSAAASKPSFKPSTPEFIEQYVAAPGSADQQPDEEEWASFPTKKDKKKGKKAKAVEAAAAATAAAATSAVIFNSNSEDQTTKNLEDPSDPSIGVFNTEQPSHNIEEEWAVPVKKGKKGKKGQRKQIEETRDRETIALPASEPEPSAIEAQLPVEFEAPASKGKKKKRKSVTFEEQKLDKASSAAVDDTVSDPTAERSDERIVEREVSTPDTFPQDLTPSVQEQPRDEKAESEAWPAQLADTFGATERETPVSIEDVATETFPRDEKPLSSRADEHPQDVQGLVDATVDFSDNLNMEAIGENHAGFGEETITEREEYLEHGEMPLQDVQDQVIQPSIEEISNTSNEPLQDSTVRPLREQITSDAVDDRRPEVIEETSKNAQTTPSAIDSLDQQDGSPSRSRPQVSGEIGLDEPSVTDFEFPSVPVKSKKGKKKGKKAQTFNWEPEQDELPKDQPESGVQTPAAEIVETSAGDPSSDIQQFTGQAVWDQENRSTEDVQHVPSQALDSTTDQQPFYLDSQENASQTTTDVATLQRAGSKKKKKGKNAKIAIFDEGEEVSNSEPLEATAEETVDNAANNAGKTQTLGELQDTDPPLSKGQVEEAQDDTWESSKQDKKSKKKKRQRQGSKWEPDTEETNKPPSVAEASTISTPIAAAEPVLAADESSITRAITSEAVDDGFVAPKKGKKGKTSKKAQYFDAAEITAEPPKQDFIEPTDAPVGSVQVPEPEVDQEGFSFPLKSKKNKKKNSRFSDWTEEFGDESPGQSREPETSVGVAEAQVHRAEQKVPEQDAGEYKHEAAADPGSAANVLDAQVEPENLRQTPETIGTEEESGAKSETELQEPDVIEYGQEANLSETDDARNRDLAITDAEKEEFELAMAEMNEHGDSGPEIPDPTIFLDDEKREPTQESVAEPQEGLSQVVTGFEHDETRLKRPESDTILDEIHKPNQANEVSPQTPAPGTAGEPIEEDWESFAGGKKNKKSKKKPKRGEQTLSFEDEPAVQTFHPEDPASATSMPNDPEPEKFVEDIEPSQASVPSLSNETVNDEALFSSQDRSIDDGFSTTKKSGKKGKKGKRSKTSDWIEETEMESNKSTSDIPVVAAVTSAGAGAATVASTTEEGLAGHAEPETSDSIFKPTEYDLTAIAEDDQMTAKNDQSPFADLESIEPHETTPTDPAELFEASRAAPEPEDGLSSRKKGKGGKKAKRTQTSSWNEPEVTSTDAKEPADRLVTTFAEDEPKEIQREEIGPLGEEVSNEDPTSNRKGKKNKKKKNQFVAWEEQEDRPNLQDTVNDRPRVEQSEGFSSVPEPVMGVLVDDKDQADITKEAKQDLGSEKIQEILETPGPEPQEKDDAEAGEPFPIEGGFETLPSQKNKKGKKSRKRVGLMPELEPDESLEQRAPELGGEPQQSPSKELASELEPVTESSPAPVEKRDESYTLDEEDRSIETESANQAAPVSSEIQPDEEFHGFATKKGKKGKKGKKNKEVESTLMESSKKPDSNDLSPAIPTDAQTEAIDQTPPEVEHQPETTEGPTFMAQDEGSANDGEWTSFSTSKQKKAKKGKKQSVLTIDEPQIESEPFEIGRSLDERPPEMSYQESGLLEKHQHVDYNNHSQPSAASFDDVPVKEAIFDRNQALASEDAAATAAFPGLLRHEDSSAPPQLKDFEAEPNPEEDWALPAKKGKKSKKKRKESALIGYKEGESTTAPAFNSVVDDSRENKSSWVTGQGGTETPLAEVEEDLVKEGLKLPTEEAQPEEEWVGFTSKKGKKGKKSRQSSAIQESLPQGGPTKLQDEEQAITRASEETTAASHSRSSSIKDAAKAAGAVGAGIALFEGIHRASSMSEEQRPKRQGRRDSKTDPSETAVFEEVPQSIESDQGQSHVARNQRTISAMDPAYRDSALHMESPMIPEPSHRYDSVRDSGFQDGSEDVSRPLEVSIEASPDYEVSISSPGRAEHLSRDHEPQPPSPVDSRHTSPRRHLNDREPSPVDSTSKDRSASLFGSSPSTREEHRYHDKHRSIDEITSPSAPQSKSIFGGPAGINSDRDFEAFQSPPRTPLDITAANRPLATIEERSPEDSPRVKETAQDSEHSLKPLRRSITPQSRAHHRVRSPNSDNARRLGLISTDDLISRLSWPEVDEEKHAVDLERSLSRNTDKDRRSSGGRSRPPSLVIDPNKVRSASGGSVRSNDSISAIIRSPPLSSTGTPPLRRVDRSLSSDLRAANRREEARSEPSLGGEVEPEKRAKPGPTDRELQSPTLEGVASSSTYDPAKDKGKGRIVKMTDVYEGYGDLNGSPRSPTRPQSVRRRQSMQILDLEAKLDQLVSENRLLVDAKNRAERNLDQAVHDHSQQSHALNEALGTRDLYLQQKDDELEELRRTLQGLQEEVGRLNEANNDLGTSRNVNADFEQRYRDLEDEHSAAREQLEEQSQELEELRHKHTSLSGGMEGIVAAEVALAVQSKNAELKQLRSELETAKEQVRKLQQEIMAARRGDDSLVEHDEDYFDTKCEQLCRHVQQWVMRFSKFSDNKLCRRMEEVADEKITDRFDNAILDGTDVDAYLADRVKRRDVFMSVMMSMVWEYIFTRYLFGMDREQRQKLKYLEKTLSEVGPPSAVNKWRANTLTMLAKREGFQLQRQQDTEAVVHEIYSALSAFLTPPSHLVEQLQESLRKVLSTAVDLSIDMRTQKAQYIMLPPLQPEFNTNGDLETKVYFNAASMNERSGDTVDNKGLEETEAVVRIVLFPLVIKQGSEDGEEDEREVICPAQVLVAKEDGGKDKKDKRSVRVVSAQGNRSQGSIAPSQMEGGYI